MIYRSSQEVRRETPRRGGPYLRGMAPSFVGEGPCPSRIGIAAGNGSRVSVIEPQTPRRRQTKSAPQLAESWRAEYAGTEFIPPHAPQGARRFRVSAVDLQGRVGARRSRRQRREEHSAVRQPRWGAGRCCNGSCVGVTEPQTPRRRQTKSAPIGCNEPASTCKATMPMPRRSLLAP